MSRPAHPEVALHLPVALVVALRGALWSYLAGAIPPDLRRTVRDLCERLDNAQAVHDMPVPTCTGCGQPMERCASQAPCFHCSDCRVAEYRAQEVPNGTQGDGG